MAGNPDTVFRDFPRSKFPFTMELLDAETREVRWSVTIEGPGAVQVPSKDEINGGRLLVGRITFADGEVQEG